tara:strand:- start:297 stop:608 length:312 start_codon:yes stop_codon:yes gene_type:complete
VIRNYELNNEEFKSMFNTDAMVVFMSTKFEISDEQAEYIRTHATMPFHIRSADYPKPTRVVYFCSSEEAIRFQLSFENMAKKAEKPVAKILDIKSQIKPNDNT